MCKWLKKLARPEEPFSEECEAEALWYRSFQPHPEVNYSLALEEARRLYSDVTEETNNKDAKAKWLFGIAFPSMAAATAVIVPWELNPWLMTPTMLFLVIAMLLAVRVVTPGTRPTPMPTKSLLGVVRNEKKPEARLAAGYHVAITGLLAVNSWKSLHLKCISWSIVLAACFFIIPVAYRARSQSVEVCSPPQPSHTDQESHSSDQEEEPEEFPLRAPKPEEYSHQP